MKRLTLLAAIVSVTVAASTAGATTQPAGWYWTTARATSAFKLHAWSAASAAGLGCKNQKTDDCNFTVACAGLAVDPSTKPGVRDVLKPAPGKLRFRFFRCTATSECFATGSWVHYFRTNASGPANQAYDAQHLWDLGGQPRANPGGCARP